MTPLAALASAGRHLPTRPLWSRPPLPRRHSANPGPPRGAHPTQRRRRTRAPPRRHAPRYTRTPTPPAPPPHTHPTLASRRNRPPPLRCKSVQGSVWKPDTPTPLFPASARSSPYQPPFHTRALKPSFPRHPTPRTHPTPTHTRARVHTRALSRASSGSHFQRAPGPAAPAVTPGCLWEAIKVLPGQLSTRPRASGSHSPSWGKESGDLSFFPPLR